MTRLIGGKQLYALLPGIAVAWNYAEKYSSTLYKEWNHKVLRNFQILIIAHVPLTSFISAIFIGHGFHLIKKFAANAIFGPSVYAR